MIISISNGHGLNTPGKRTPPFPNTGQVIKEWEFNYATARKLRDILQKQGYKVVMVSDTSNDTPLKERVNKANSAKADLYISIHYNAYQSVWGNHGGIETLYSNINVNNKRLANLIQKEMIAITKLRDRGIKLRNNIYELNNTKMPSALVECGFMDNLDEAKLMLDNNYQLKCANAIARGINLYFGKDAEPMPDNNNLKDINIKVDVEPIIAKGIFQNGTNYVPVRVLEQLGFKVTYDKETDSIIISYK